MAHEPAPGSTLQAQWEPLDLIDSFVNDPSAPPLPFPATVAYRVESGENYLTPDPGMPNAVIGFEPSAGFSETLSGSEFDDMIFSGDNLAIADEDLPLLGSEGDQLFGMRGNDWMVGDRLNNFFDGGRGDDHMEGRGDDDIFVWGVGRDFIDGGEGYDVADYGDDPLDGNDGIEVSQDQDGNYSVYYADDNLADDSLVSIEEIRGTPQDDEMSASSLVGVEIADHFFGGGGNDLGIFRIGDVGAAPDEYDGGFGNDTLRIVIRDPLSVSSVQVIELLSLQTRIGDTGTFPALGLTLSGWEALEILDPSGDPLDPNDLIQNPPTEILLSNASVDEETPGAFVGELTVDDRNNEVGDSHTFDLSDARFEVRQGNGLFLAVGTRLDFEVDDLNPNEQHSFSITLTSPAGSATQFEVEGGILKLADADSVDFESQPGFVIEITVEDKDGLTLTESFTLSVTDVDENAAAPSLPTDHFQLNGTNGFGYHHAFLMPEDLSGVSIASAGDMTHDGVEDLIVTSTVANGPFSFANFAFLIPGADAAFPDLLFRSSILGGSDLSDRGGTTFFLSDTDDRNRSVVAAGIGDFNGDGNDDLLLRVHNTATLRQEHAVVFGSAFLPGILVIDPATLPAAQGQVVGFATDPAYGFDQGIGGLIDLNGDGFHDLAFADPATDFGFGNIVSMAYVLFGGDFGGLLSPKGTGSDDFPLGGRTTDDILIGGPGNDTLVGLGSRDVFYGGTGDDLIVAGGVGMPEYVRIDGGAGTDTVRLDSLGVAGNNLVWDLRTSSNSPLNSAGNHLVSSIEIIDLGLGGPADRHKLILAVDDLIDLPEADLSLTIIGDASDSVTFVGPLTFSRSEMRQGINFDIYAVDGTNLELLIAAGLPIE